MYDKSVLSLFEKQRSNKILYNDTEGTLESLADTKNKTIVVFYLRVSTKHKAQQEALKEQEKWMHRLEEQHPEWDVKSYYIDFGKTGTNFKRPNFEKMMLELEKHQVKYIITREVSRFGRNVRETLNVSHQLLNNYDIGVYFALDKLDTKNPKDLTRLADKATASEEEARRISEKVRETQNFRIEYDADGQAFGTPRGSNCFGYTKSKVKHCWDVYDSEAEAVKFIFNSFHDGMKVGDICSHLKQMGVSKKGGGTGWTKPDIYRILSNWTYTGYQIQNKTTIKTADFLEKKKTKNEQDEWILVDIKKYITEIISLDLFMEVRGMIKSTDDADGKLLRKRCISDKSADVWKQLLLCKCGYTYVIEHIKGKIDEIMYSCNKRHRDVSADNKSNSSCKMKSVPLWKLLFMYNKIVNVLYTNIDIIIEKSIATLEDSWDAGVSSQAIEDKVSTINTKIGVIDKKRLKFQEMLVDELMTLDDYNLHIESLNSEKQDLLNTIDTLKGQQQNAVRFEAVREIITDVFKGLIKEGSYNSSLVRNLVDLVVHVEDNKYMWFLNLGEDGGDILEENRLYFQRHYSNSTEDIIKDKSKKLMSFKLGVEEARNFKYLIGAGYVKRWKDIEVEVYL